MAKQEALTLRVDKPLKDAVARKARAQGIPTGEYVRRLLAADVRSRG